MRSISFITFASLFILSCGSAEQNQKSDSQTDTMAEESQFDPSNSDAKAVELADKVIEAHGGMEAWDDKRFVSWNFLGARDLVWDKYTGLVRIDYVNEETTYLINVHQDSGKVMVKGNAITEQDSLQKLIVRGEQIWVNDSYWLVFPFKLKDPGVRLYYQGVDTTLAGNKAEVISLQFDSVGYTPQNKYLAYINPETYLIMQWDYFRDASDSTAAFRQLWSDYKEFDGIKLAAGRADRRLENIQIANELEPIVFQDF